MQCWILNCCLKSMVRHTEPEIHQQHKLRHQLHGQVYVSRTAAGLVGTHDMQGQASRVSSLQQIKAEDDTASAHDSERLMCQAVVQSAHDGECLVCQAAVGSECGCDAPVGTWPCSMTCSPTGAGALPCFSKNSNTPCRKLIYIMALPFTDRLNDEVESRDTAL